MAIPGRNKKQREDRGQKPLPRWMFETRTDAWQEAGLSAEVSHGNVGGAFLRSAVLSLLFAGTLVAFDNRGDLVPDADPTLVRIITAILLGGFGWGLSLSVGKVLIPAVLRRMAPATAGSVGFILRLAIVVVVAVIALRVAGLRAETLVLGGAFTFVIVGLAAQQTLGNIFAGIVLQGTRPFRVGERVRVAGGPIAGPLEGTVGSLGLFYTALVQGGERIMVPNSALLQATVTPLRDPAAIELRARFSSRVSPLTLQSMMREKIEIPTHSPPEITIEEIERDDVVLLIRATPRYPADASRLAESILAVTRERLTGEQDTTTDELPKL